ncbi:RluA family pseudouridine synthase [Falsigemmobacter faecalis]|uniref:Pseudouridine synthase n=1 Tax=Falsigemmobacter faecalis TaxID=2488730 RepID=A0A3P3D4N8_9RHOB|nr:RluA family pseudouridine synthase [Falsigemmobacter faecalis]RRH69370.1 RluA family pseudouridine synthase [Falsigemmobacter faecalis]
MSTDPFGEVLRVTLGEDTPSRLDKALALYVPEGLGLSRSRIAKLVEEGSVRRGGEVLIAKSKVAAGEEIGITLGAPEEVETLAEDIPLEVVYEDDDLIVINKPAGMVVHPAVGNPRGTLVNALLFHCGESLQGIGGERRPGIVHRIDKDTSGLLVAAKTAAAHQGLAAQFEAHTVHRHYLALVHGVPYVGDPRLRGLNGVSVETGGVVRIATQLDRHRGDRQKQAVVPSGGRHAVTRARVVEAYGQPAGISLIDCWLETGRTHQIRVHMAYAGHGLIGDQTYGGRRKMSEKALGVAGVAAAEAFPRQALHAATLGFTHPISGEDLHFESPLPQDICDLIEAFAKPVSAL